MAKNLRHPGCPVPLNVSKVLPKLQITIEITLRIRYYNSNISPSTPRAHTLVYMRLFRPMLSLPHRYAYEISFIGRDVIGNVQNLTADTASCSAFVVSGGGQSELTVTTANEGEALGTGTTVQSVKVRVGSIVFVAFLFASTLRQPDSPRGRFHLTPSVGKSRPIENNRRKPSTPCN